MCAPGRAVRRAVRRMAKVCLAEQQHQRDGVWAAAGGPAAVRCRSRSLAHSPPPPPRPPPHTTTTTHHASCRLDILQAAVEAQGWRFCRIDGAVASATERQDRWVHWSAHALPAVARDATPVRSPTPYPPPFLPPSPPCAPTACRSVRPPPGFQSSCLPARRAACSCVCMPGPCMRVKNTQPSPACCACCMRAPACPPTWCVPAPRLRPCAPHAARKQVGGLGLTLTAADRVVIVDPAWNPS